MSLLEDEKMIWKNWYEGIGDQKRQKFLRLENHLQKGLTLVSTGEQKNSCDISYLSSLCGKYL